MQFTEESLIPLRGTFTDQYGEPIATPGEHAAFTIAAGYWPSPNIGARQVRCACCHGFASLSPEGWRLHRVNPDYRPIFCPPCFLLIQAAVTELEKQAS
jgi:hypothetical protein